MERADHINRMRAALSLCLNARRKLRRLLGNVIDLPLRIPENNIAHLLRLLDWAQLRRQKDQPFGLRSGHDCG
ncbi:MAG: hypothetical protein WB611_04145 [Stellaceae bacterium]